MFLLEFEKNDVFKTKFFYFLLSLLHFKIQKPFLPSKSTITSVLKNNFVHETYLTDKNQHIF